MGHCRVLDSRLGLSGSGMEVSRRAGRRGDGLLETLLAGRVLRELSAHFCEWAGLGLA